MKKVTDPQAFLRALFDTAVEAASPGGKISLDQIDVPEGRTAVIAAGKAAASMAQEVERSWTGDLEGIALTRYEHGLDLQKIRVIEAGHPVPDEDGEKAAVEILELAGSLTEKDLLIFLVSGGGSALLSLPAEGLTLNDKKAINKALLKSGASISEINTVRKKLSLIKGGRLAVEAWPAKTVTYMISDVPGDDPSVIASGPTVPDATTCAEALAILERYSIDIPSTVREHLQSAKAEPPVGVHPAFAIGQQTMIATPQDALQAAAGKAREVGVEPLVLGDSIEGESKDVAAVMAGITRQILDHDEPVQKPCVILSGGETTVTVSSAGAGAGRGGRNAEFLLAFAECFGSHPRVHALAADTDGIDGTEDNAGAVFTPQTHDRAKKLGLDLSDFLRRHDAYRFFEALEDLIMTGPTRTNVNDFRAILILPEES